MNKTKHANVLTCTKQKGISDKQNVEMNSEDHRTSNGRTIIYGHDNKLKKGI